jgi:O-antigen ligase
LVIPGPKGFQRTEVGLAATAFLAPFSSTLIVGSLTIGRATVLGFALLLGADLLEDRPRGLRPEPSAILLAVGMVGLWVWISLSTVAWGCNCGGKTGGFTEFAVIGLLALIALAVQPRLRSVALISTLAGLVLASLLALGGVGAINSGTVDLSETGGRLSGTYGNANELGFAAALGIPIALAYRSFGGRNGLIVMLGAAAVMALTIVLTYSRGGVIAAGIGVVVVLLWEYRGSRRAMALVLAGAVGCVIIGALLYKVFENEREEASFEAVSPALRLLDERDLSGWDSRSLGPIPNGPSHLANGPRGIVVSSSRAGEGASFSGGEGRSGGTYTLRLRVASPRRELSLWVALGDSSRIAERRRNVRLGTGGRELALSWAPRSRSAHATAYIWQESGPSAFTVANPRVVVRGAGGPGVIAIPDRLQGSLYDRLASNANRSERRFIESRLDAARLAVRAFRSEPIRGIGWATFPAYADEHLEYGQLAVHDQYLALAAELGMVGILLAMALIAAVAIGIWRTGRGMPETAAIGVLAAAAAGFVFVEALPVPQLSIPIAIAAAVVCAQRRSRPD